MKARLTKYLAMSCGFLTACAVRSQPASPVTGPDRDAPPRAFVRRSLVLSPGERWIGNGISYGPHRDGQHPGGPGPTREQVREDLEIVRKHWSLLRMYAVGPEAETALQLIRAEKLPLKVMLGAWIAMEAKLGEGGAVLEDYPQARAANRMQVDTLIRLANEYPDIVPVITVGNETQVFWSAHKVPADTLIRYIREVRAATKVPVATADDFNYWNKPESRTVAREIDFIVTHIYAMWAGQPLDRALPFTQEKYAEVAQMHPGFVIVLGEAGWATQRGRAGETHQGRGRRGAAEDVLRSIRRLDHAGEDRELLLRSVRRELERRPQRGRGREALGAVPGGPHTEAGPAGREIAGT